MRRPRAKEQAPRRGLPSSRWASVALTLVTFACQQPPRPVVPRARAAPAAASAPRVERFTASPRPDPHPETGINCGAHDLGLRRVAAVALEVYNRTSRLPSSDELTFELRAEGLPYVWVRSWAATGQDRSNVEQALADWVTSLPAATNRRCGVSFSSAAGTVHAVAVVADVLADVSPVPRRARVGQWLTLEAKLHVEASQVSLLVLGPHGAPHNVPVQLTSGNRVRARVPLASPGRWLLQLLPTISGGPRPVSEIEVFVETDLPSAPEQSVAPGEDASCATHACDPTRLVQMVNRARASEKLPPLRPDPQLAFLATAHARAMRDQTRLAHDTGQGDAYIRVAPEFPDATLIGENIAHAADLRAAHRALWASPAHRQNLLRREYGSVGVGVAVDATGHVWVCQLFAAQNTPSATY